MIAENTSLQTGHVELTSITRSEHDCKTFRFAFRVNGEEYALDTGARSMQSFAVFQREAVETLGILPRHPDERPHGRRYGPSWRDCVDHAIRRGGRER